MEFFMNTQNFLNSLKSLIRLEEKAPLIPYENLIKFDVFFLRFSKWL